MSDFLADTDVTLMVMLSEAGSPQVPDADSLTYTVRDQAGATIDGLTDVAVPTGPTTFQVPIAIPAVNNSIADGRRFEKRAVAISYTVGGVRRQQIVTYRLTTFLNHSVSAGQVRGFIGVQQYELPDEDIDLLAAFLKCEKAVGLEVLSDALASGTTTELTANTLIRMQAVLDVLPSLKQRVAQSETNGPKGFTRPTIRDFSEIEENARDRYSDALSELTNANANGASFTLAVLTQDTDPITG